MRLLALLFSSLALAPAASGARGVVRPSVPRTPATRLHAAPPADAPHGDELAFWLVPLATLAGATFLACVAALRRS